MSNKDYYIIIDCPPGSKRPDDMLKAIILQTQLSIDDFTTTSKTFGSWTFELKNKNKINDFIISIPIFEKELNLFHKNGSIRYAEWYIDD